MARRLIEEYLALGKHGGGLGGPLFRPVKNNRTGTLDKHLGSRAEVLAMENLDHGRPSYLVAAKHAEHALAGVLSEYKERKFRSARHAVLQLQADLNQAMFRQRKG